LYAKTLLSSADVSILSSPPGRLTISSPQTSPSQWDVMTTFGLIVPLLLAYGISAIDPFFIPIKMFPLNISTALGGASQATAQSFVRAPPANL